MMMMMMMIRSTLFRQAPSVFHLFKSVQAAQSVQAAHVC